MPFMNLLLLSFSLTFCLFKSLSIHHLSHLPDLGPFMLHLQIFAGYLHYTRSLLLGIKKAEMRYVQIIELQGRCWLQAQERLAEVVYLIDLPHVRPHSVPLRSLTHTKDTSWCISHLVRSPGTSLVWAFLGKEGIPHSKLTQPLHY